MHPTDGAVGIESATIKVIKDHKIESETILNHLNGKGIFRTRKPKQKYSHYNKKLKLLFQVRCNGCKPDVHIETAIDNGKRMPCLIIYVEGLCRNGMFDDMIVEADKNLFALPYPDTLSSKALEYQDWLTNIIEFHNNYKTK